MQYTPFFQGTEATNIINDYLKKNVDASTPIPASDMNAQGKFRNPYLPEGFYPNDSATYPDATYTPPVKDEEDRPQCPPGFVYDEILKQCVYVGDDVQEETRFNDDDDDEIEERPYYSIDAMKDLSDEKLIEYLKDGFLTNSGMLGYLSSKGDVVTIKDGLMPPAFKVGFGKQDAMRRKFIEEELIKRGFGIGTNEDGQQQFNINPILFNENLYDAVLEMNVRQDNKSDYAPVIKEDGTIGYKSVDRTSGDFYQQTRATEDLGSLLSDDGSRNQKNYDKALRENVRRTVLAPTQTISYRDPDTNKTYTANAPRSNFSKALGGFTGGR